MFVVFLLSFISSIWTGVFAQIPPNDDENWNFDSDFISSNWVPSLTFPWWSFVPWFIWNAYQRWSTTSQKLLLSSSILETDNDSTICFMYSYNWDNFWTMFSIWTNYALIWTRNWATTTPKITIRSSVWNLSHIFPWNWTNYNTSYLPVCITNNSQLTTNNQTLHVEWTNYSFTHSN